MLASNAELVGTMRASPAAVAPGGDAVLLEKYRAAKSAMVRAAFLWRKGGRERRTRAVETAHRVMRELPDYGRARNVLARWLFTLGVERAKQGKREEAVRTLTSGAGEHPDLHAELARLAFERGDYEAARKHADAAIRLDRNQLLARWIQGELLRTSGKLKEAEEAYSWLIRFYNLHQSEINRAESLRWIGLAAARYARWNRRGRDKRCGTVRGGVRGDDAQRRNPESTGARGSGHRSRRGDGGGGC